jgi:hypothetical protein
VCFGRKWGVKCEKKRPLIRRRASGTGPRRRNRQKPVYRPIRPTSRHQNPATGGKPHRITVKAPFNPASRFRPNAATGEVHPEGCSAAAKSAFFCRICVIRRRDPVVLLGKRGGAGAFWQEPGQNAKKMRPDIQRGASVAVPDRGNRKIPFTARFAPPRGTKIRQRAVNRTGLRQKRRFNQPRDFGQTRPQARCARRVAT